MTKIDLKYLDQGHSFMAGCDEVGRGPLAGPVVSCCVFIYQIDGDPLEEKKFKKVMKLLSLLGVTDSKKLSKAKREDILETMGVFGKLDKEGLLYLSNPSDYCLRYVISEVSHKVIDEINILKASLKSMRICINKGAKELGGSGHVLIDGKFLPQNLKPNLLATPIIKGDSKSHLIGLASVLAKSYRDSLMEKWAKKYPGYGLDKNAGYPTLSHKEAIKALGVSPIHRKTFRGVREFVDSGQL